MSAATSPTSAPRPMTCRSSLWERSYCVGPHPGSSRRCSGSPTERCPDRSPIWSWSEPVRPVWPPRSTGRRRASTPSPWTRSPWRSGGASSRIENYVGFPNGISGGDLRPGPSSRRNGCGARLNAPCEAVELRTERAFHIVHPADRQRNRHSGRDHPVPAPNIDVEVADLERYEGAGVYYTATELEARLCRDTTVGVVGGGNSAGQARHLPVATGEPGHPDCPPARNGETMSQYLIARIEADPHIEVVTQTEVRGLAGDTHLEEITLEHTASGARRTVRCGGLFCFIGAIRPPPGARLRLVDRNGFVLTDSSLSDTTANDDAFPDRDPLPSRRPFPACSPSVTYDWAP